MLKCEYYDIETGETLESDAPMPHLSEVERKIKAMESILGKPIRFRTKIISDEVEA